MILPIEKIKYLFFFVIAFVLIVPFGTITHEIGHIVVANLLGYETNLYYDSMKWSGDLRDDVVNIYSTYSFEIENNLPFIKSNEYKVKLKSLNNDALMILLGGIFQTILSGSLAFWFFLKRRKKYNMFNLIDWFLVFVSLFWSREVFNLLIGVIRGFWSGNGVFFYGDEAKVANLLGLHNGFIAIPLGILGIIIILKVVSSIPKKIRFTFNLSAIIGCLLGFVLWMNFIGKFFLPKN